MGRGRKFLDKLIVAQWVRGEKFLDKLFVAQWVRGRKILDKLFVAQWVRLNDLFLNKISPFNRHNLSQRVRWQRTQLLFCAIAFW